MDDVQLGRLMSESRALLTAIPGVREVFSGDALREDDKYKFCWVIRFANKTVIDSFTQHPDFLNFSKKLFKSYACESVTINYQENPRITGLGHS